MTKKMLKLVVFVLVIGLIASFAQADLQWDDGGADNLWTTPENWEFDVLPVATDMVAIDNPGVQQPLFEAGMNVSVDRVVIGQNHGPCTLTVTGGSLNSSGKPIIIGVMEGSEGTMNINGGNVVADAGVVLALYYPRNSLPEAIGTLNMNGGTLTVHPMFTTEDYRNNLVIGRHGEAVMNMSGGTVYVDENLLISLSSDGNAILNMTGGAMDITDTIGMSTYEGNPPSEFHLDGGVITAADLLMNTNARLDITDGTMILDGDDTATVQGYIDSGLITAYGYTDAVKVDYDVTNTGKTTIIGDPDFNVPPTVDAGDYQSILWPGSPVTLQLAADTEDDGNPVPPGQATLTWSKVKGPGTVTFDPCNAVEDPCATFSAAGWYQLRLNISDSEKEASDTVDIYIRPNDNPIAHWDFNEGSDPVNDDSANNNVGTRTGDNEPNWISGWIGSSALEFFGVEKNTTSSYVTITSDLLAPDPNLDNLQYEVTLAAWFKIDDLANAYHPAIVANSNTGWRLYVETAADKFAKVTFTPGDSLSGPRAYSTRPMNDGYWHHVVGIYDGLKSYLYIDGVLDVTVDNAGLLDTTDGVPVTIGARNRKDDLTIERSWNGMLDDVRVYSYGLSADQVADLADMGNLVPRVDAGDNQTFSMQDGSLQLDGTVIDDGKPEAATIGWTKTDGPGTVTFSPSTDIEDPTATFSDVGTYVLRLTADDTIMTVYDEVTIEVVSPTCQDVIDDGLLLVVDISGPEGIPDCYINLYDFAAFAGDWLRCNNPQDLNCEFPF